MCDDVLRNLNDYLRTLAKYFIVNTTVSYNYKEILVK